MGDSRSCYQPSKSVCRDHRRTNSVQPLLSVRLGTPIACPALGAVGLSVRFCFSSTSSYSALVSARWISRGFPYLSASARA